LVLVVLATVQILFLLPLLLLVVVGLVMVTVVQVVVVALAVAEHLKMVLEVREILQAQAHHKEQVAAVAQV
jgi:nitrate reductase gamma subunit